jgi:hypothetical protein
MCLVRCEAGNEDCTCKDFEHRQGTVNTPYKHILASQLEAASDASEPER